MRPPNPLLVAITGGSGSGKTTLADALARELGPDRCIVVTEDAYYLPRDQHAPPTQGLSVAEIEGVVNFDDPASKDMSMFRRHLEDLRAGQAIDQPVYRFDLHDRTPGQSKRIEPRPVILVEGVHVLWDTALAGLYHLKVYVDTRDDLRLIRRIRRDQKRGRTADRVMDQYLRFVRPSHARFTEPAKFDCDIVLADEGILAVGQEAPDPEAVARLTAPVWVRLEALGVRR